MQAKFPQLRDRAWVLAKLAKGTSNIEIARELGCSSALVCRWLARHGLDSDRSQLSAYLDDREWLERVYVTEGRNANQVAGMLGCNRSSVLNALKRMGIPTKSIAEAQMAKTDFVGSGAPRPKGKFKDTLNNKEWLQAQVDLRLSLSAIARRAGASATSTGRALKRAGIELNSDHYKLSYHVTAPERFRVRKPERALQSFRSQARRITPHGPCVVCGRPGVDVNHKDRNPKNNEPSNLERLCKKCHRRQEAYELKVMRSILTKHGITFAEVHRMARKRIQEGLHREAHVV